MKKAKSLITGYNWSKLSDSIGRNNFQVDTEMSKINQNIGMLLHKLNQKKTQHKLKFTRETRLMNEGASPLRSEGKWELKWKRKS